MKLKETQNKDIVLFALYELGGAKHPVHTEDVAHKVFQYPIGRQRYRWTRYDEYPDKERVARELRRLKNWQGSKYVKGHVNIGAKRDRMDGWMLTSMGVERVKNIEKHIADAVQVSMSGHSIYDADDLQRRIKRTTCYGIYLEDHSLGKAEDYDFTDLLYCLPDASKEKIQSAFDELLANAKAVDAREIIEFLEEARNRFRHLLSN